MSSCLEKILFLTTPNPSLKGGVGGGQKSTNLIFTAVIFEKI